MILFLLKGLIRDRSRSLFPFIIVSSGVVLTVVLYSWIAGTKNELVRANANLSSGHVKITTRAYLEEIDQIPNDLAIMGITDLLSHLQTEYPSLMWTPRIRFGGLIDVPDESGETKSQGAVVGLAVDLLSSQSPEPDILNLNGALVQGRLPQLAGEILLSEQFAKDLNVQLGETVSLISSTMYGSMAAANFEVVGTIHFGVSAMDRGAIIAELEDIQYALDLDDSAGEILGFFQDGFYDEMIAEDMTNSFNTKFSTPDDEFSPYMATLRSSSGLSQILDLAESISGLLIALFVIVMSIVLWNAGLMGSIRRYGEMGIRLAIGEEKGHVYRTLIAESLLIGVGGSLVGTVIGIAISYYLQIKGINIAPMMKNASMMISNILRADVTPNSYLIGFVPGLVATLLGSLISGLGIYRRQTSSLMKEFEA